MVQTSTNNDNLSTAYTTEEVDNKLFSNTNIETTSFLQHNETCSDVQTYHDGDLSGPYYCDDYKLYKWCENCKRGSGCHWEDSWGSVMPITFQKYELSCGCCSNLSFFILKNINQLN